MVVFERSHLLQTIILGIHVGFRGSNLIPLCYLFLSIASQENFHAWHRDTFVIPPGDRFPQPCLVSIGYLSQASC